MKGAIYLISTLMLTRLIWEAINENRWWAVSAYLTAHLVITVLMYYEVFV